MQDKNKEDNVMELGSQDLKPSPTFHQPNLRGDKQKKKATSGKGLELESRSRLELYVRRFPSQEPISKPSITGKRQHSVRSQNRGK